MPRRKEKEYTARREQIMDGALQVFASKGFEQATNKDIAEAAGIGSPALIYHYFKDKSALFQAVLESRVPLLQLVTHPDAFYALPLREALTRFAALYLRMVEDPAAMAFIRMLLGEAVRKTELGRLFFETGPNRAFGFLSGYFQRQMESGTLRHMEPAHAVRCFMGPLVTYILARGVLQQTEMQQMDPEAVVETTVEVFLRGMQA